MARIVIELTNRCNLRCRHCFSGRHGGNDEMPIGILEEILIEATHQGFNEIAFTGGEPSVHRHFAEVMRKTTEAGYSFGFVSNGWRFPEIYKEIPPCPDQFQGVTFSMDGASESSHDELRGKGSYRRLLSAFSICVAKEIPFTINTVLTKVNQHEIEMMVDSASAFGSRGIRFGHFISTDREDSMGLPLFSEERCAVEDRISRLQATASVPVIFAPGCRTTELFPCEPLQEQEINVDYDGNVGLCCQLSNHGQHSRNRDVVGNLNEIGFNEAVSRMRELVRCFRAEKRRRHALKKFSEEDYLPCHYCITYFRG